ncbi:UNVERIFIED_CONTAM: hypothetical protein FKN15_003049 [Acipenser sinensis]
MDVSVSVSCFHDELASTVERALKAAVDTVLCEITKTVGGRFAEKEKENEKLKLRLEMSERELRAVRECMKTLQDVIAHSSVGANSSRPPQDCQLHTPNDSLAFRLPGNEKGFVTEEDRASAQFIPKSRQRDCNPSTARSAPANRDDVNPRFLPVEAFEHIEDAWAPEWGEGVDVAMAASAFMAEPGDPADGTWQRCDLGFTEAINQRMRVPDRLKVADPSLGGEEELKRDDPPPSFSMHLPDRLSLAGPDPNLLSSHGVLNAAKYVGWQVSQRLLQAINQKFATSIHDSEIVLEGEDVGVVEVLALRRQLSKMSRRLAGLEKQSAAHRQTELVLFTLLVSASLVNS